MSVSLVCLWQQKSRRGKVFGKVNCKNIKQDCPDPDCDNPILLSGHCCKTCPKGNHLLTQSHQVFRFYCLFLKCVIQILAFVYAQNSQLLSVVPLLCDINVFFSTDFVYSLFASYHPLSLFLFPCCSQFFSFFSFPAGQLVSLQNSC